MADSVEQSDILRLQLKAWEKSFAAANQGRKAERDDIKRHPEIAQKYKTYNKLRSRVSSFTHPSKKRPSSPSRILSTTTPQKRQKQSHPLHPSLLDPYDSPRSIHQTPTHRKSIGPTPQKDGFFLGLFDLLSPAPKRTIETPSRKARSSLGIIASNSFATPSKPSLTNQKLTIEGKYHKSSPTTLKRLSPASFLTPSNRRICDTPSKALPESRSSALKLRLDETPAFLKRNSQHVMIEENSNVDEDPDNDNISWSPIKVRMRAKPAGKGLSALVRGLREMEEERLDDEMDLLREMEMEIDNPQRSEPKEAKVFVFDSQVPDMPLGADGENESESEVDEDALNKKSQGRDSRPFKTWKKKGQKRTTRRVCLKPSTAKWKPEPKWNGGKEVESDQESAEAIAETQEQPPPPPPLQPSSSTLRPQTPIIITSNNTLDDSSPNSDSGSDFAQDHALHPPTKAGKTPTSRTRLEAANAPNKHDSAIGEDAKANGGESSKVGRKRKKVAATAHANFRALKIRGFAGGKSGMRRGRGGRFAAGRR